MGMIKIKNCIWCGLLAFGFLGLQPMFSQEINQFDSNKQRTGVWKKYYKNNRIRYEGQFKNGKEVGTFKFYDISSSNHPIIIKKFRESSDSVFTQFFTTKGLLQSEGYFIGRKRVGKWSYFFPTRKKMSEENFKDGSLNGTVINYYPNGKITEKSQYKNGMKHGKSLQFTSDGSILEEVNYENGKLNGPAKYYDIKGQLKEQGTYKNGKRIGQWEYYLDGEVVTKKKKSTYKKQND